MTKLAEKTAPAAAAARIAGTLSLPLALSGDTPTDPDMNRPYDPVTNPNMFDRNGLIGRWWNRNAPSWLGGGSSAPIADTTMNSTKRAFLSTLAQPESGGQYDIKNGGAHFFGYNRFPEGVYPGGTTSAAGRYQFVSKTYASEAGRLGLTDFSPASQDKAAWDLAWSTYRSQTGRDLEADLKNGHHNTDIAQALKNVWPSLPGGSQSTESQGQFDNLLQRNFAAEGVASQGHVQVDVHLKGAPPGTTARVTTTGPVTAPPPRVETPMPGVN
jgi:muramidase (phage lysozyme)